MEEQETMYVAFYCDDDFVQILQKYWFFINNLY